MAAGYSKAFMPLSSVKEKQFMSRPMGCKGIGFSFVRYKPGEGATHVHRHKVQEEVLSHSKVTVPLSSMAKGSRCRRERSCGSAQEFGGHSATILKKKLCI
jgi:hypothetical protein